MSALAALGKLTGFSGGSLSGGISSGKSSTSGSGTSTTKSSAEQTGIASTNASGLTTTTQTSMDAASKALLDELTKNLSEAQGGGGAGFTKADAVTDVSAAIKQIFEQYKQNDLPQIAVAMGQAGAYNSTNAQLLANDAFAEAIGKASTLTLDTIKSYAGISKDNEAQATNALLEAFKVQSDATKSQQSAEQAKSDSTNKVNESGTSTTNDSYDTTTKSSSKSLGFKLF